MSIKSPYKENKINIKDLLGLTKPKNPKGVIYPQRGKKKILDKK